MRLKNFTQAYFLIKCNNSYSYSLIKRAAAVTNFLVLVGVAGYFWYPSRIYSSEKIN
jgi:hypothetical protein